MKILRLLFFFLIALVVATAILSFLQPTSQKIEKSVMIKASPSDIYEQLKKLDHFNKFSVWAQQDSSAVYTLKGNDGTVGATSAWKGDPEISGEGSITITALEPNKKVEHDLIFTRPRKGKAHSSFSLVETERNNTKVTWTFNLDTPRPWNIFNLFYSLDKEMGKDFETGLATLKLLIESSAGR